MKWTTLLIVALSFAAQSALAADAPRIFYSKSFPGSVPAYVEITVDEKGRIEYREAPKEEDPIVAQLSEADTKEIWALAEKLNWFSRPLESGLKVARMGDKTLRIENHAQKGEVKFNFTQDEDGRLLQDWFEKMNESAQHRIGLERTVRFDKLGVNKSLLLFEASMDRKRIVAPEQFLPLLDRVAKNESYMHMARERAVFLAETIRQSEAKGGMMKRAIAPDCVSSRMAVVTEPRASASGIARSVLLLLVLAIVSLPAQQAAPNKTVSEEDDLRTLLGEAGSSPTEMIRALEKFLAKYPATKRRGEAERALVKAAIDARDNARILKYGEKYLSSESTDLLVLERVTRLLTTRDDKDSNERGLKYALLFEQGMRNLEKDKPAATRIDAQLREDLDRGISRAYTFQARANGHLGKISEAVELAKKSFDAYPSAEPARELATWLIRQGKEAEALPHLADAFSLPDPRFTDEDRRAIRKQMGEVHTKLHGSEKGMGDVILAAYDRSVVVDRERGERMRAIDPNSGVTNPMEYTITGVNGEKLDLKSLRGKVVVLDFWATWCGPCRVQYPMYEQVKQRFKGNNDIVFLGINTDQEREVVKPFLKEQKWNKAVYFEDGLSNLLRVSSIPATLIYGRNGDLFARFNGFVPERFVDMLTERINESLAAK